MTGFGAFNPVRTKGLHLDISNEGGTELFIQRNSNNHGQGTVINHLALIPSIPFILVLKAFSTGMKGLNGMLRMAFRATHESSPPLLRVLPQIEVARGYLFQGMGRLSPTPQGPIFASVVGAFHSQRLSAEQLEYLVSHLVLSVFPGDPTCPTQPLI